MLSQEVALYYLEYSYSSKYLVLKTLLGQNLLPSDIYIQEFPLVQAEPSKELKAQLVIRDEVFVLYQPQPLFEYPSNQPQQP